MNVETDSERICIEADLPIAPDRAWELVADTEHRKRWWGDHADLEVRPGGDFREVWSDAGRVVITSGEVTRCDPPTALELTWADEDWPGYTEVALLFVAHGGGTRFRLEHRGWGVHEHAGRRHELIDAHAGGWSHYLACLVEYASAMAVAGQSSAGKEPAVRER